MKIIQINKCGDEIDYFIYVYIYVYIVYKACMVHINSVG